jgi:sugar-phosphatase
MQLNTVIFDMDGLLIDSEPLWNEAANIVFGRHGIHLTEEQYALTTGLRTREFVSRWLRQFGKQEIDHQATEKAIVENVVRLVKEKGAPMPGVDHIFRLFRSLDFHIGLASSSPPELISVVTGMLGISDELEAVASAETLAYGKPHPQVYLDCAGLLSAAPAECICFEDSFHGMIAAKAAGMKCVIVPSEKEKGMPRWNAADLRIGSLDDFNREQLLEICK